MYGAITITDHKGREIEVEYWYRAGRIASYLNDGTEDELKVLSARLDGRKIRLTPCGRYRIKQQILNQMN